MIEVLFVYKKRLGTEVATGRYICRIVMRDMAISNAIQFGWVFTYQFPYFKVIVLEGLSLNDDFSDCRLSTLLMRLIAITYN